MDNAIKEKILYKKTKTNLLKRIKFYEQVC